MNGNGKNGGKVLLQLQDVQVAYGGIQALRGVTLHVEAGELVALVGSNGVGKSTALKASCGLVPLARGEIRYDDTNVASVAPHDLVRRGMALVPQGRGIFGQLTVEENLVVGAYSRADRHAIDEDLGKVYARFPLLKERRRQTGGTLSGGEQQMLAIGRALMSRPKLVLLDEPSMGLAPIMVNRIFETIEQIVRDGITVLLVAQNARLALEISHRAYVMDTGAIALSGSAQVLLDDPQVQRAYLGG